MCAASRLISWQRCCAVSVHAVTVQVVLCCAATLCCHLLQIRGGPLSVAEYMQVCADKRWLHKVHQHCNKAGGWSKCVCMWPGVWC